MKISTYAFGMGIESRNFVGFKNFRYGFNKMEKVDEISGNGNSYDFGARVIDTRISKWFSLDPYQTNYTSLSPYNFVANSPLVQIDKDGKDIYFYDKNGQLLTQIKMGGPDVGFQSTKYAADACHKLQVIDVKKQIPPALASSFDFLYKNFVPSAVGVGGAGSFTPVGGWTGGIESVNFLKGPDVGKSRVYGFLGPSIGMDIGVSPYVFQAAYFGDDKKPTVESWEGTFNSYSVSLSAYGGVSFFWGTKDSEVSLVPGTENSEITWAGISFTPPVAGAAHGGTKYSHTDYKLLPEVFQIVNPDILAEKLYDIKRVDPSVMDNSGNLPATESCTDDCDGN